MTIKVCKEKTTNILVSILKGFGWFIYFSIYGIFAFGVYRAIYEPPSYSSEHLVMWLLLLLPPICIILGELIGSIDEEDGFTNKGPLRTLNAKLKIFEWNEDC